MCLFYADFDGNGHTIRNLFIHRPDAHEVGLFGAFHARRIRRVGLVAVDVTGKIRVGGLVGVSGGRVTDSFVTGRVTGRDMVGGLIGYNFSAGRCPQQLCGRAGHGGNQGWGAGREQHGQSWPFGHSDGQLCDGTRDGPKCSRRVGGDQCGGHHDQLRHGVCLGFFYCVRRSGWSRRIQVYGVTLRRATLTRRPRAILMARGGPRLNCRRRPVPAGSMRIGVRRPGTLGRPGSIRRYRRIWTGTGRRVGRSLAIRCGPPPR